MEIVRCVGNKKFSFLRVARRLLTKRYTGIPMTKKKFAELELSLCHLQHNVEIPKNRSPNTPHNPTHSLRSPSHQHPPLPTMGIRDGMRRFGKHSAIGGGINSSRRI